MLRAGLTVALLVALLQAIVMPAAASPGRLSQARARLGDLAAEIAERTAALQARRETLTIVNQRIARASERLGALELARQDVVASIERARARREAVQDELDRLAAEAFMDAGPGSTDATAIDLVLGSGSFMEATDRLAYADAASSEVVRVAGDISLLERDLEVRASAVDALASEQTATVSALEDARDAQAEAAASEAAAFESLEAARRDAIALVERLATHARGAGPVDLSGLGDALQGEHHVTYGRWAQLFLDMVDAPVCRSNLVAMAAWQAAESTQAAWNPLATTHRMPGSSDFNSVGVQDFVSLEQGLLGTWETIENGWTVYGYGAIVRSLRRCGSAMASGRAINASSWCPGCVGGVYVLNVIPHVEADLEGYLAL